MAGFLGLAIAPEPIHAATFAVNSSNDESDDNSGDGVCRSAPSRQCTLRAAIVEANALAGADVVNVPAMAVQLHIVGSDDTGLLGDLDIRQDLRIIGAGAGLTVIDASRISPGERVFDVHPDLDVRLADLTITGGQAQGSGAGGDGGGIRVGRDSELRFDGGRTRVHPLQSTSPAVDSSACLFIWDQRGVLRPRDGNGDGASECDIGSYELIRPEIPGR